MGSVVLQLRRGRAGRRSQLGPLQGDAVGERGGSRRAAGDVHRTPRNFCYGSCRAVPRPQRAHPSPSPARAFGACRHAVRARGGRWVDESERGGRQGGRAVVKGCQPVHPVVAGGDSGGGVAPREKRRVEREGTVVVFVFVFFFSSGLLQGAGDPRQGVPLVVRIGPPTRPPARPPTTSPHPAAAGRRLPSRPRCKPPPAAPPAAASLFHPDGTQPYQPVPQTSGDQFPLTQPPPPPHPPPLPPLTAAASCRSP